MKVTVQFRGKDVLRSLRRGVGSAASAMTMLAGGDSHQAMAALYQTFAHYFGSHGGEPCKSFAPSPGMLGHLICAGCGQLVTSHGRVRTSSAAEYDLWNNPATVCQRCGSRADAHNVVTDAASPLAGGHWACPRATPGVFWPTGMPGMPPDAEPATERSPQRDEAGSIG